MKVKLLKKWNRFEGRKIGDTVELPDDFEDLDFYVRVGMIELPETEQTEKPAQTPAAYRPGKHGKR